MNMCSPNAGVLLIIQSITYKLNHPIVSIVILALFTTIGDNVHYIFGFNQQYVTIEYTKSNIQILFIIFLDSKLIK